MISTFRLPRSLKLLVTIYLVSHSACAQRSSENSIKAVLQKDSLFWAAYNNCEVDRLMQYVDDDLEFSYDNNGVLNGKENFRTAVQKKLCGNKQYRLRREAMKNTIDVYSMKSGDKLYGLQITGEHLFYVSETGKNERPERIAKFKNLWELKNGKSQEFRVTTIVLRPIQIRGMKFVSLRRF